METIAPLWWPEAQGMDSALSVKRAERKTIIDHNNNDNNNRFSNLLRPVQ